MPNRRSRRGNSPTAQQPAPDVAGDLSLARHDAVPLAAPLRALAGAVTCCFCGARVREAELVRPIWGPRPCPQGHLHSPLEVVARCRSCAEAERHRLEEHARRVARMQASLQELSRAESVTPREQCAPSAPAATRRRTPVGTIAQASLF